MSASLTVVMPVFNEAKNLGNALKETMATLDGVVLDYEFVVVNDGSHDDTDAIARQWSIDHPRMKYVAHAVNQGIGAAFRSGVALATKDYVILVPADNPLMPEDLAAFHPHMGKVDIIAGSRVERTGYPASLKFLSFVYNRILVPMLFGLPLKDVNWIQMYRRRIFNEWQVKIESNGIFFFVEVLVKAHRKGASMVEVPMTMRKRIHGRPTISRLPVITKTFKDMMTFFLRPGEHINPYSNNK